MDQRIDVNMWYAWKSQDQVYKSWFISGRKSAYKKAYITVAEGETIDLYSNI